MHEYGQKVNLMLDSKEKRSLIHFNEFRRRCCVLKTRLIEQEIRTEFQPPHPQAIFPTRVACLPPSNWADKNACKMSMASSSLMKRAGNDKTFASLC